MAEQDITTKNARIRASLPPFYVFVGSWTRATRPLPTQRPGRSAVLHGEAGYWLLKYDAYRKATEKAEANPNKDIIQRMLARGISVELCVQTMKSHGWKADDALLVPTAEHVRVA